MTLDKLFFMTLRNLDKKGEITHVLGTKEDVFRSYFTKLKENTSIYIVSCTEINDDIFNMYFEEFSK